MDESEAENMTLPELREHLASLEAKHGAKLQEAESVVNEMVARGAVLKTKRGRPPRSTKKQTKSTSKSQRSQASDTAAGEKGSTTKKQTRPKKKVASAKTNDGKKDDSSKKIRTGKVEEQKTATTEETEQKKATDAKSRQMELDVEAAKQDQEFSDNEKSMDQKTTVAEERSDAKTESAKAAQESRPQDQDFSDIPESDEQRFRSVRRSTDAAGKDKQETNKSEHRETKSTHHDDRHDDKHAASRDAQRGERRGEQDTHKRDDKRSDAQSEKKVDAREDKKENSRNEQREHKREDKRDNKSARQEDNADKQDEGQDDKSDRFENQEIFEGVLELMPDGYGFLRTENYIQSNQDIYVSPQFIRRFNLRQGDFITGPCRHRRDSDRYQALSYVSSVNGLAADQVVRRPHFERLTPIYPNERFVMETSKTEFSTRIIDLVAPIGKGQRGMIVSPPKAGKTILLQKIANAISIKNPEAHLIVLLIDERPEEVTDMQRSIKGEVVYSTFDKTPENHVRISELVLERAMRMVELGQDVVILLDSITRLARAYNLTINPTGRTLSGGLDPGALNGPKRFFGAARNIEHGGSLTIVATSLVETGSRMDEVIFEEFKGTGNMEVYLDRKLSEKRIFPAIDIVRSGTRREDLLLSKDELDAVWAMRKAFGNMEPAAVTEMILSLLLKTNNNHHFVSSINVSLNDRNLHETMNPKKQLGGSVASI
ncbi:MAG TPA: transcription termination factor Rho [Clostridiaceae bacterium]|nr:transcription termination factor Rho [Clostridiaceae bacterium]